MCPRVARRSWILWPPYVTNRLRLPAAALPSSSAAALAPEAAAATATAFAFRARFVHVQRPAVELSSVDCRDRLVRLGRVAHLDKCKAAGAAGFAVGDDADAIDRSVPLE